jgi:aspartokinase-like uncharacterized kinase
MENNERVSIKESLLNRLLSGDAKESSKRALAIYVVIVICTGITVVALVRDVDQLLLLGTWLAFAASLLGMSEYNKNRTKKHEALVQIEKEKAKAVVKSKSALSDETENLDESQIN